jgi:tripeptidyl-peptidase-1
MKLTAALCLLACASAQRVAVEDEPLARPTGWTHGSSTSTDGKIQLTFAVKQQNLEELERVATAVSDPRNEQEYGKHMSIEQLQSLLAPTPEAVQTLTAFLLEHGVSVERDCEKSSNSDFIRCLTTIGVANKMLQANYLDFVHEKTGETAARTLSYTLPANVAKHIDFVVPTIKLPALRAPVQSAKLGDTPNRQNTPASLRSLYAVGDARGNTSSNIQACTAFLGQHYKQSDLDKFNRKYYSANEGQKITVVGTNSGRAGVEASLDIEYISAMGGGVNTQFWTFAGNAPDNPENEPFLDCASSF